MLFRGSAIFISFFMFFSSSFHFPFIFLYFPFIFLSFSFMLGFLRSRRPPRRPSCLLATKSCLAGGVQGLIGGGVLFNSGVPTPSGLAITKLVLFEILQEDLYKNGFSRSVHFPFTFLHFPLILFSCSFHVISLFFPFPSFSVHFPFMFL